MVKTIAFLGAVMLPFAASAETPQVDVDNYCRALQAMILQVEKIAPDSDVHVTITVLPRDETHGSGSTIEKLPMHATPHTGY
jgi:hypothetical protein